MARTRSIAAASTRDDVAGKSSARPLPLSFRSPRARSSSFNRSNDAGADASVVSLARSGSYSCQIAACSMASVAPRLAGWSGLPSIFVGRPSFSSAMTPRAYPSVSSVVA